MAEAEINISEIFRRVPFGEDKAECGYFSDRESTNILTSFNWMGPNLPVEKLDCILYERLLRKGYRRYHSLVYQNKCQNCRECIPIRIHAKDFIPSKSQRKILRINQDVEVTIITNPDDF